MKVAKEGNILEGNRCRPNERARDTGKVKPLIAFPSHLHTIFIQRYINR